MFKKLIVALGNPGKEYSKTRHNVGQIFFNYLDSHYALNWQKKFNGRLAEKNFPNIGKIAFFMPNTFMNISGVPVREALKFYKSHCKDLVVFHDDIDMTLGKIRVKQGGGNGGHNGIRSIDAQIGSRDYLRVKIGVGRPENKEEVSDYVLANFSQAEAAILDQVYPIIYNNLESLLQDDIAAFNKNTNPKKPADLMPKPGRTQI